MYGFITVTFVIWVQVEPSAGVYRCTCMTVAIMSNNSTSTRICGISRVYKAAFPTDQLFSECKGAEGPIIKKQAPSVLIEQGLQ